MFSTIRNAITSFASATRIEYRARQIEQARKTIEREDARYAALSKAQKAQHDKDTDAILKRAAELRKPAGVIARAHAAAKAKRAVKR